MLEFLAEYGLFLLKVATIVVAIIVVIGFAAETSKRSQGDTLEVDQSSRTSRTLGIAESSNQPKLTL